MLYYPSTRTFVCQNLHYKMQLVHRILRPMHSYGENMNSIEPIILLLQDFQSFMGHFFQNGQNNSMDQMDAEFEILTCNVDLALKKALWTTKKKKNCKLIHSEIH